MELENNTEFDNKFMDFMVKPKELGGLGFLLPGEFYEEMKQVQSRNINQEKNEIYPYADYFKILRKFSLEEKYKELYQKVKSDVKIDAAIPKIAYSLDSYKLLSSKEFVFLM